MLSPEDLSARGQWQAREQASALPISLSDIDVIEALVVWLSTAQGDAFVSACVAQHEATQMIERSRAAITKQS